MRGQPTSHPACECCLLLASGHTVRPPCSCRQPRHPRRRYAASALLRNCPEAQAHFVQADGVAALVAALAEVRAPKLVRKALVLLTDLLDEQLSESEVLRAANAAAAPGVSVTVEPPAGAGALSAEGNENALDEAAGLAVGVEVGVDGGASRVQMMKRGLLEHGLQNGTRLCEATLQCLRMVSPREPTRLR